MRKNEIMISICGKCEQCGERINLTWDSQSERIINPKCVNCGTFLKQHQYESLRHSMDALASAVQQEGFPFAIKELYIR